ncbi:MAG TPA: ATP-binding protein [Kofleriaceae bacterium]
MGLAAVDKGGWQTYVSPAFCRMVGYTRDELIGACAPFAYWPTEELDTIQHAFALTVEGRAPAEGFELRFARKDGQRFWVQLAIAPMFERDERIGWLASLFEIEERKQLVEERAARKRQQAAGDAADAERRRLTEVTIVDAAGATIGPEGAVEEWIGTNTDISERAHLYQEMRRARAEAEAARRAKDVFLAMLGHELRNPLAPILTALQLMRLRDCGAALKERSVIERQVTHLVRLVDDLLDVSRITRGKIELARQPIEIAEVIAKAIEMSSTLLEQQRHRLSVVVPPTGLRVDGDHARLAQVFGNLVTNAAKYTPPEGHVHVTAQRDAGEIVVLIKDDGEGIDPGLLARVFDLFEQGERTIDRARGGLGIGLTIVKTLVELHGGRVAARSGGLGAGSEFEVRLPASCGDGQEDASSPVRLTRPIATRRAVRVLLVDDNQDAVLMLSDALNALGYETRVAHDGPSGIAAAMEFQPAIAMLDIGLPVMDGYELARRLRERAAGIQLIAMTGYGQDADRCRSRDAGFLHHLVKPFDLEQVAMILGEISG